MLKVGRKRKRKEKKERQKAHKLYCQDSSSRMKLHHVAKKQNTRHVRSLNIMSGTITRPTV